MNRILLIPMLMITGGFTAEPAVTSSPIADGRSSSLSQILGRPTDRSIALSLLSSQDLEVQIEYGSSGPPFNAQTPLTQLTANIPTVVEMNGLQANTAYGYHLRSRCPGQPAFDTSPTNSFHTQRAPGSTFTFGVQGDSHPERRGKMFNADLYVETMRHVAAEKPDFYIMLGDDFSIERLIERKTLTQANVDQVYAFQRQFLGMIGSSSALFLVNGNHEQAGRHWLDGTTNNPAVLAGRARNAYYALPAPNQFYAGDSEEVPQVGLLRDYYAWTWGDALFVTIDPYWHSTVEVDHDQRGKHGEKDADKGRKKGKKAEGQTDEATTTPAPKRDLWQVTIGDVQYQWLRETLTKSTARYKFVFAHHVMGTGRGGIEEAKLYEWGGQDRQGNSLFASKRPTWDLPIHELMVKAGVTIFFQGHDHIFARQSLDGVVYQSTPNPADDTYQAFNRERYQSGDVFPNSGHLRVTVAPDQVRVDYIRSFLAADENAKQKNGATAFSYQIPSKSR